MPKTDPLLLQDALIAARASAAPVLAGIPTLGASVPVPDLGVNNPALQAIAWQKTEALHAFIFDELAASGACFAAGGYGEDRLMYRRSAHFDGEGEPRSIHLGIDLWLEAGAGVCVPFAGTLHSQQHNDNFGDYGPTIITEHELDGQRFWLLYGHLSKASLGAHPTGASLAQGATIGWLGTAQENGGWPPHLHVQLIAHIGEHWGDYPGVCAPSAWPTYRKRCLDPNLLLGIASLPVQRLPVTAL